ncbi:hypothetical protein OC846_002345 [Tilletia horrida]|uniref:Uncharacterized protein n=1 Tax=Tilletia horrida TaxID=155126 RepID=A0AAN6JS77_9BASI|nr:hypothetical protein OC846_002345 [Tilletia horrida]KAK0567777.1 hypothetical protein OC861_002520 [Tilletia horrida]
MRIRARCPPLRIPSRSSAARSGKNAVVPIKTPTDISQTELATSRFFASHRPLLDLDLLAAPSSTSPAIKITTSSSSASERSASDSPDSNFTVHTINITAAPSAQPPAHAVTHATALLQDDTHTSNHGHRSVVIPSAIWSSKPKITVTPEQFNQLIDELAAPASHQDEAQRPSPKVITSAIKLLANDSYLTSRNAAITRALERGESPLLARRLGVESELVVLGEANGPRVEWARGVALWLAENGRAYVPPPPPLNPSLSEQDNEQKLTRRERMRLRRQAHRRMMATHSSHSSRGRIRAVASSTSVVSRYSRSFSRHLPAYIQARLDDAGAAHTDEDVGIPIVISDPEACVNIALMEAENALSSPGVSLSSGESRSAEASEPTTTITVTGAEAKHTPESSTAVIEVGEDGIRPHLRAVLQQIVDKEVKESQTPADPTADGLPGDQATETSSDPPPRTKGTIAFIVTSSEQARDLTEQLRKGESIGKVRQKAAGAQQSTGAQETVSEQFNEEQWEAVEVDHDEQGAGSQVAMSQQGLQIASRSGALVEEEDYDEEDEDDDDHDLHGDLPPADPNMLLSHALVQARLADSLPSANALTLIDDALAKLNARSADLIKAGLMDLSTLNADLSDIQTPALRVRAKEAASERRKSLEATAKALSASIAKLPVPESSADAASSNGKGQEASFTAKTEDDVAKSQKDQSSAGSGAAFTIQGMGGGVLQVDVNGLLRIHRRSSLPKTSASTSALDAETAEGKAEVAGNVASKSESAAVRRTRAKRTARVAAIKAAQKARVK